VVDRDVSRVAPNRIDRPGTAEEAWDEWAGLKHLPVADPLDWPSVIIVAAHLDDEVLGAGGVMGMLAAAGTRLRLIAVTDGETSHPAADPEVIGRVRTEEPAAAREVLGARDADVVRLRLPATGLAARKDELADRLGKLCAGFVVCLARPQACQVALTADVAAEKKAAIGAFASQLTGREGAAGPVLPPGIVAHFTRPLEVLLR
jgi:LmbE family N-acetylglucosaminyl deacetylase